MKSSFWRFTSVTLSSVAWLAKILNHECPICPKIWNATCLKIFEIPYFRKGFVKIPFMVNILMTFSFFVNISFLMSQNFLWSLKIGKENFVTCKVLTNRVTKNRLYRAKSGSGWPTNLIFFFGTCLHPFGNFLEKAIQNTRRCFCSGNR